MNESVESNRMRSGEYARDYVPVAFGSFLPEDDKINFGQSEKHLRVCRYCLKRQPETTFRKTAHGFPYFMGNRTLIDRLECDGCNSLFSTSVEHHFSNYFNPLRTIGRIAGRSGVPTYKAPDGSIRIDAKPGHLSMSIESDTIERLVDPVSKLMTIKMQRPAYSPVQVYKMFVKMALAVMPSYYMSELELYRRWLLQPGDALAFSPMVLFEWRLSGPLPPERIRYVLHRSKPASSSFVRYVFVILVGNYQYQIGLPINEGKRSFSQSVHVHPTMVSESHLRAYGAPAFMEHDMAYRGVRIGEEVTQTIQFEDYEESGP